MVSEQSGTDEPPVVTPTAYHPVMQLLHWVMALMIIGMLALGIYMDGLALSPTKLELYGLHKSIGVTVLGLAVVRFICRFIFPHPPLPAGLPGWQRLAARLSHTGLYLLIFAMPITGWLMSSGAGFPVSWFGIATLPDLIASNKDAKEWFGELHEILAFALMGLIGVHVLAALQHQFILKDGLLTRMLPFSR